MSKLNVVDFPLTSLADIPAKLRDLADKIESGEHGEPSAAIVVLAGDELEVFGYGEATGTVAHYLLCCAQRKIEKPFIFGEV